ncbi:MAG: SUMF1/EgtB/PvdO family nonheme iron enzyme [Candidatus Latescibacteria bacterium]|nr:SUMF1/EgtB/PvdO family nonheme iron enzyme [Candidatus Latescibacterota bacterium]
MAGNVNEWVADWFEFKPPYQEGEANPQGPTTSTRRTTRGGNWSINTANIDHVTTWFRAGAEPERTYFDLGFRCAWDETVPPPTTAVENQSWGIIKGSLDDR